MLLQFKTRKCSLHFWCIRFQITQIASVIWVALKVQWDRNFIFSASSLRVLSRRCVQLKKLFLQNLLSRSWTLFRVFALMLCRGITLSHLRRDGEREGGCRVNAERWDFLDAIMENSTRCSTRCKSFNTLSSLSFCSYLFHRNYTQNKHKIMFLFILTTSVEIQKWPKKKKKNLILEFRSLDYLQGR